MMSIEDAAHALTGIIAAVVIVALWLGPVRLVVEDWARDSMFAARDTLFDAAMGGHFAFDDPRYRTIRQAINNNIRFAHTVSSARLGWHYFWLRNATIPPNIGRQYAAAREFEDPVAREIATTALAKTDRAMLGLLFFKTPVVSSIVFAVIGRPQLHLKWPLGMDAVKAFRPYAYLIQVGAAAEG